MVRVERHALLIHVGDRDGDRLTGRLFQFEPLPDRRTHARGQLGAIDGQDPVVPTLAVGLFGGDLDLLGFVPPRIEARLGTTGVMDPTMVELQEKTRSYAMDTPHLEPKMVQMMLFGMLLMAGNDAAQTHCIAARRCGASWEELQATINLCFLFRGLPAANRGAHMLASVAAREAEQADGSTNEQ